MCHAGQCASFHAIDELPLPYLEMDAHGIILRANRAALALHPPERGELVGQPAWKFLTVDQKDPSLQAYAELMQSGTQPPVVLRNLYDRSGEFRTYEFHRSLILDADGKPAGMRMVCRDVTACVRELADARQECARLAAVFACLCDAVIVTDALGFIAMLNPAAESLLGRSAADLAGKAIESALPLLPSSEGDSAREFILELTVPRTFRREMLASDGRGVGLEIRSSPLIEKQSGLTSGVVLLLRAL